MEAEPIETKLEAGARELAGGDTAGAAGAAGELRRDDATAAEVSTAVRLLGESGHQAAASHLADKGVAFDVARGVLLRRKWRRSDRAPGAAAGAAGDDDAAAAAAAPVSDDA